MLLDNTLWGIYDKEAEALELLRIHEPTEGYYVAYSGGKDSTVVLDLIRRSGVKYDAHYSNTTVDPPELIYFIRRQPDVAWEQPPLSMWDLIPRKLMPPTRTVRYCCDVLKERHGKGRIIVTGIRAAESIRRRKRSQIEKCNKVPSTTYLHLIFNWSNDDVWEYIHRHNLDYCSLYDEGFQRIGCICCPFGGPRRQLIEANRWPKYKFLYIMAFDRLIANRLRLGKPCEWHNGYDVWDWWTSTSSKRHDLMATSSLFDIETS